MSGTFEQCEARLAMPVFSRYAYGDPMPHNALYVGEEHDTRKEDAITIWVRCEREAGHDGKHLARGTLGWTDASRATEREGTGIAELSEG